MNGGTMKKPTLSEAVRLLGRWIDEFKAIYPTEPVLLDTRAFLRRVRARRKP